MHGEPRLDGLGERVRAPTPITDSDRPIWQDFHA